MANDSIAWSAIDFRKWTLPAHVNLPALHVTTAKVSCRLIFLRAAHMKIDLAGLPSLLKYNE